MKILKDLIEYRELMAVLAWNAYVERYNRTVRNEWLNQHLFESIAHAQETATQWLWRYNNERPHLALGGITPAQKLVEAE